MLFPKLTRREVLTIAGAVSICGCTGDVSTSSLQTSTDQDNSSDQPLMNRIIFPGNPWPNGHAIKELVWSARLDPNAGLFFDLHLESDDYYAEDGDSDDDDYDEDAGDWESKIVWNNFHACTLSSTYWGHMGFIAATREQPLSFAALPDRTFKLDPLPPPDDPYDRAFGVYLLGHDGVADHLIRFTPTGRENEYNLDWRGKIALEYVGSTTFNYSFHARHDHLRFSGVEMPEGTNESDAQSILKPFMDVVDGFTPVRRDDTLWLVPK